MNVAIDALVRERYELPAQELDRLVRHVRAVVNRRLNDSVAGRLDAGQLARVEGLLDVPGAERAARCTTLRHRHVQTSKPQQGRRSTRRRSQLLARKASLVDPSSLRAVSPRQRLRRRLMAWRGSLP